MIGIILFYFYLLRLVFNFPFYFPKVFKIISDYLWIIANDSLSQSREIHINEHKYRNIGFSIIIVYYRFQIYIQTKRIFYVIWFVLLGSHKGYNIYIYIYIYIYILYPLYILLIYYFRFIYVYMHIGTICISVFNTIHLILLIVLLLHTAFL